jgi:hypothetical protein
MKLMYTPLTFDPSQQVPYLDPNQAYGHITDFDEAQQFPPLTSIKLWPKVWPHQLHQNSATALP